MKQSSRFIKSHVNIEFWHGVNGKRGNQGKKESPKGEYRIFQGES